jgi:hypothetical protein
MQQSAPPVSSDAQRQWWNVESHTSKSELNAEIEIASLVGRCGIEQPSKTTNALAAAGGKW